MHLSLEGLIQNSIAWIILNVLPASVAMSEIDYRSKKTNRAESKEPHKFLQIKTEDKFMKITVSYLSSQFENKSPAAPPRS